MSSEEVAAALPSYDVGDELGRGGWGVVLAGRHRQLDRKVAIKQLPQNFASDPSVRNRFAAEARALASLDHPHVVPVYDYVERDGLCLLVMEQLPGGTVWSRFANEGFTAPAAVAVTLASAAGLAAAHARGILHRDVKPENLMFAANGAVKVTDFGIAKVIGGDDTMVTRAGNVLGTPAYIAPEQARGAAVSPATDVYALATMLYELLAGTLPFPEEADAMALLFKHAFEAPKPLLEAAPLVPAEIADVVMWGLATDPDERCPTADEFGVQLAAAAADSWGPGWLAAQGMPVVAAARVLAASERGSVAMGISPPPSARSTAVPTPAPVGNASLETVVFRAPETARAEGAKLVDLAESDLRPVANVPPRSPTGRAPMVVAAVLAVAAIVIAIVGIGSPSYGGTIVGSVNGVAVGSSTSLPINLTNPVVIEIPQAVNSGTAKLSLQVLGKTVVSKHAPLKISASGGHAKLQPFGRRYVVAGAMTAVLAVSRDGVVDHTSTSAASTTESGVTTVTGGADLLLILFCLAYLESFGRALRKGRRLVSASIGLPITAAALAVALAGAVWLLFGQVPTTSGLVVGAVVGGAAGVFVAIGGLQAGRRRRDLRQAGGVRIS